MNIFYALVAVLGMWGLRIALVGGFCYYKYTISCRYRVHNFRQVDFWMWLSRFLLMIGVCFFILDLAQVIENGLRMLTGLL